MPSSKRKPRRKAADLNETSEVDMPDSSPVRPSAKKRRTNAPRTSTKRKSVSPQPAFAQRFDDSGDESETVSQSDLIDSVVSYLQVAKELVVATTEYANEKEQPESMGKVSAFAKIAGRDWTYFVRDQAVNIGRPPDGGKDTNGMNPAASSPLIDLKEVLPVHIDLGPSKIVSRHHASIFYDSEWPEGGGWHIRVNGRNGVRVNNNLLKRGHRQQIKSGAILEIAGTQMMFVTPSDKAQIDQSFIDRAKALATGEEFPTLSHAHPEEEQNGGYSENAYPSSMGYQSLAPAPPNFQRASTPPQYHLDGKHQRGVFDSKPPQGGTYNRGMVMGSTQEIDYGRDAAKDLKPPFSYATMIAQAIFSSEEEKLTLSNIYAYIVDKFSFYRHSNSGWQNSIRHNLSLNKAFQKVPRRTDEPGKGMKWQIAPEYRQEYWKKQARKGASSAPSSPASGKEVNPNFRGPNGQNLGYDTTMVSQFSAKDMSDRPVPPPPAKMHFGQQQQPSFTSPRVHHHQHPNMTSTPQRQRANTQDNLAPGDDLDSPIHPHRQSHSQSHHPTGTPSHLPTYTLPSPHPPPHHSPSNPTLSSSYLDTPGPHSSHPHSNTHHAWPPHSAITPAPLRQNPRLAPPSTLVAPSKFMPDSSPGGPSSFWKGLYGTTPANAGVLADMSPVKDENVRDRDMRGMMSSSPPPMDGGMGMGSPSKPMRSSQMMGGGGSSSAVKSNGLGGERNGNGNAGLQKAIPSTTSSAVLKNNDEDDDEDEGVGGFDLAKGFAPIGSQRAQSQGAAAAGR